MSRVKQGAVFAKIEQGPSCSIVQKGHEWFEIDFARAPAITLGRGGMARTLYPRSADTGPSLSKLSRLPRGTGPCAEAPDRRRNSKHWCPPAVQPARIRRFPGDICILSKEDAGSAAPLTTALTLAISEAMGERVQRWPLAQACAVRPGGVGQCQSSAGPVCRTSSATIRGRVMSHYRAIQVLTASAFLGRAARHCVHIFDEGKFRRANAVKGAAFSAVDEPVESIRSHVSDRSSGNLLD
ncbi:hypothetical protein J2808_004474 [Pseudarthrobacter sulfonivorans]|nr:hypothetical protein [Pseudarthrobacter sulfonivorans]